MEKTPNTRYSKTEMRCAEALTRELTKEISAWQVTQLASTLISEKVSNFLNWKWVPEDMWTKIVSIMRTMYSSEIREALIKVDKNNNADYAHAA